MSQFCGSFCALINRSLLTVILYCATDRDADSEASDTPANATQAIARSVRLRCGMTVPPMKPTCGWSAALKEQESYRGSVARATPHRDRQPYRLSAKSSERSECEEDHARSGLISQDH